ncbi:hypothetical protein B5S43_02095 [Gilliamella apicola]|uniref:hypothetical protein n=1 Tax=Gilliamella apicola TaxID=1196095 RepID=UPI000A35BE7D|nr:hypothetical protein [Gilliamella apicola]OTQ07070.1 hypothetical protein B5S43_02095 [Gilliamella apicola]
MKKIFLIVGVMLWSTYSFAKAPDCASVPMNTTATWMQNEGIIAKGDIDSSKTKINLLASEKNINTNKMIKKKFIYTNIYNFVFYDDDGKSYQVITKINTVESPKNRIDCSYSGLGEFYFVSKEGGF